MNERDRLIALLDQNCGYVEEQKAETLADYLLEHGVIVPPVKVGQTVFVLAACGDIAACVDGGLMCPYDNMCYINDCTQLEDVVRPFPMTVEEIRLRDHEIYGIFFEESTIEYFGADIGVKIFYTREEAEAALAERSNR